MGDGVRTKIQSDQTRNSLPSGSAQRQWQPWGTCEGSGLRSAGCTCRWTDSCTLCTCLWPSRRQHRPACSEQEHSPCWEKRRSTDGTSGTNSLEPHRKLASRNTSLREALNPKICCVARFPLRSNWSHVEYVVRLILLWSFFFLLNSVTQLLDSFNVPSSTESHLTILTQKRTLVWFPWHPVTNSWRTEAHNRISAT